MSFFGGHPERNPVKNLSERNMFRAEVLDKQEAYKHMIVAC
jgi:hypothetical protein